MDSILSDRCHKGKVSPWLPSHLFFKKDKQKLYLNVCVIRVIRKHKTLSIWDKPWKIGEVLKNLNTRQ